MTLDVHFNVDHCVPYACRGVRNAHHPPPTGFAE